MMTKNTIAVDVAPTRITFTDTDGYSVSLDSVVYMAPGDGPLEIIVADTPPAHRDAWKVAVFSSDRPPAGVSKLECLTALMKHGLTAILNRSLWRRTPIVEVRGAGSLTGFGGYERDLLARALTDAGARQVRWPEDLAG